MDEIFDSYVKLKNKLTEQGMDSAIEITLPRATYTKHWESLISKHRTFNLTAEETKKLVVEGCFRFKGIIFKRGIY